jgi:hypothetical protein
VAAPTRPGNGPAHQSARLGDGSSPRRSAILVMESGQRNGDRTAQEVSVQALSCERPSDRLPRAPARLGVLLAGLLLVASTAGCTGRTGSEPAKRSPSATRPATASATLSGPPSVPMRVEVTHVAGRLAAPGRRTLAAKVGRTISAYVDAAFLTGRYPRSSFSTSFASSFTSGAARQARGEQALLTNQPFGRTTRSVRATRRTAYLSVLAPRQRVAGVTAAVDLVFAVDRGTAPPDRVELRGRLLLTRDPAGAWRIFGYDLDRSQSRHRGGG